MWCPPAADVAMPSPPRPCAAGLDGSKTPRYVHGRTRSSLRHLLRATPSKLAATVLGGVRETRGGRQKRCRLRCVVCPWFSNTLKCMVSCVFPCQQPQQVPKVSRLWCVGNVGKGSRQRASATLEKGLALRAGHRGPCRYVGVALLLHACCA